MDSEESQVRILVIDLIIEPSPHPLNSYIIFICLCVYSCSTCLCKTRVLQAKEQLSPLSYTPGPKRFNKDDQKISRSPGFIEGGLLFRVERYTKITKVGLEKWLSGEEH